MWAGNAIVGRMLADHVPPMTLNFVRWALASLVLLPLAPWLLRRGSGFAGHWKRFMLLGLVGVGLYNSLQYLALKTSSPLNVTLVAASSPLFMMLVGALFFQAHVRRMQVIGALLSLAGVALVLSRGHWAQLRALQLVPGDVFMLLAALSWAFYSWMLTQRREPEAIRQDWAAMLLAQTLTGSIWAGLFTVAEWGFFNPTLHMTWGVALGVLFIVLGPAVLAYRAWGLGVQQAGPTLAAFFTNLTPLFTALLSTLILREWPQWYHVLAFVLIVGGIWFSAKR
ncbi:MAG: DMT family transporter [Brachymonas sp.]|nr:DMT family transporter [Brachymonas sp.]